jgi:hypothetical protein
MSSHICYGIFCNNTASNKGGMKFTATYKQLYQYDHVNNAML